VTTDPCRAELALRARRGPLSGSDQLAFAAHLEGCPSCHLDPQLFADLDDDSGVGMRDGARIERLSAAARAWARQRPSSPRAVLVPEALYGRGHALAKAGELLQEQRTWQRLLRDFPTSAYAPLARRRIAARC